MAFNLSSGPGDSGGLQENNEINVTPLIDVMLVILIVFMVAAPLATVDMPVDLPPSTAAATEKPDEPVWLTYNAERQLFLGEDVTSFDQLSADLDRASNGNKETRIYLRADKAAAYGDVTSVLNALREAGYLKVALVGLEQGS